MLTKTRKVEKNKVAGHSNQNRCTIVGKEELQPEDESRHLGIMNVALTDKPLSTSTPIDWNKSVFVQEK